MSQQEKPFRLHANCIAVRGASRSAICDLGRGSLHLIPNSLFDILENCAGKTFAAIKEDYDHVYDQVIDEYRDFLVANDLIFFTTDFSLFPSLSLDWFCPSKITNCIIDIDNGSDFDVKKIIDELDGLDCKSLQIRIFTKRSMEQYQAWVSFAEYTTITSVELLIPFDSLVKEADLEKLCDQNRRITSLVIHSSNEQREHVSPRYHVPIAYTTRIVSDASCCGLISPESFSINQSTFMESLHHNTCLNRKISIDKNGRIKNCPSMKESFGSTNSTTLAEALSHAHFKRYWDITKDKVSVCMECEFRYVCTDCRAYTEAPADPYGKPLKCGYDPYTAEWQPWSTHPLKQAAIAHYDLKKTIETINP